MNTLFSNLEKYSKNTAFLTDKSSISYKELLNAADTIGNKVQHRSIVLILCKNSFDSLAGYIGFIRAGVVPLLVSSNIDRNILSKIIEIYQPYYLYLPKEKSGLFNNFKTIIKLKDYELKKTKFETVHKLHVDLAMLLSTSGSTGSPKYVRQSYKNILSNANSIMKFLGISEEDRTITTMPMNYTYGLSIINSHLIKGSSIVLNDDSILSKNFWETFKENHVTAFGGVPYIFEILKKLRFNKMELPSLKYITQAGGKLEKELCVEFTNICIEKNIKFFVMYGQVEATARISYLPWEQAHKKPGSIGIPIPGGKIWLEDEDGNVIDRDSTVGELVYQGENVTLGYAENSLELQRGDENHGILHTGDLAKRDQDGFYYIIGRKKRFLKMFGNRINLDEIEQLIRSEGYECACSGVDDSIKIFITEPSEENHVKRFISKKTKIHFKGFEVIVVNDIPRNEAGKILYSTLNFQNKN